jgi:hypothetical protein
MTSNQMLNLIERLNNPSLFEASVIPWGSPIASFGDISNSKIATLGLNPSNREFVDEKGNELKGGQRRFHTLNSLGLDSWSEAKDKHLTLIAELCDEYFSRNPYDGWFKRLDYIISGTSMSYYFPSGEACHLDLIPYATALKWAELGQQHQDLLLELTSDSLGLLLKSSSIKMIVLNGQTVVENLEKISGISLKRTHMPSWTLPRKSGEGVHGYSYTGTINKIGNVKLKNEILVLGFNHNIQSSFGVTSQVQTSIRNWVTRKSRDVFE